MGPVTSARSPPHTKLGESNGVLRVKAGQARDKAGPRNIDSKGVITRSYDAADGVPRAYTCVRIKLIGNNQQGTFGEGFAEPRAARPGHPRRPHRLIVSCMLQQWFSYCIQVGISPA